MENIDRLADSSKELEESWDSFEQVVMKVKRDRDALLEAAKVIISVYDKLPEGPIGNGFINGDFLNLKGAIANAEASQ